MLKTFALKSLFFACFFPKPGFPRLVQYVPTEQREQPSAFKILNSKLNFDKFEEELMGIILHRSTCQKTPVHII